MTSDTANGNARPGSPWRRAGWGLAAFILLLPLVAMQFTDEVNWTAEDFVFAAVLLGSVGLALEFIVRRSGSLAYRVGGALALLAVFLTVWVNAAVGMIGSEDNTYNLLFIGVIAIGLAGAIMARFRPAGMAAAMAVAGAAQAVIAAMGLSADVRGGMLSIAFAVPWLLSAAAFRMAARERLAGAVE